MNKAQFVELVQKSGNYKTKVEAENAIKAFTEAVTEALVAKEDVSLVGFGKFQELTKLTQHKIKLFLSLKLEKVLKTAFLLVNNFFLHLSFI